MVAPFPRRFVFLGWSITATWGNAHAPVYRTLLRALVARGHHVLFLERLNEEFASVRDLPAACGEVQFYGSVEDLRARFTRDIRTAHCVVVGSSIQDADQIANWVLDTARGVRAFYDFDSAATLAALDRNPVPEFDLYLSLTGGSAVTQMAERLYNTYVRPL